MPPPRGFLKLATGRANCRICKKRIERGDLALAIVARVHRGFAVLRQRHCRRECVKGLANMHVVVPSGMRLPEELVMVF